MDLRQFPTDSSAMLLNESAAKAMGFKDPIGQIVRGWRSQLSCDGRGIKDFILGAPYDPDQTSMVIEGSQSCIGQRSQHEVECWC